IFHNDGSFHFTALNGMPAIADGDVAWGDYDGDAILDLLIEGVQSNGAAYTNVLHGGGGGAFTPINGFPALGGGSVAWVDYDNDGHPDAMVTGHGASGGPQPLLAQH